MKVLYTTDSVPVPEGVTLTCKSRHVTVKGTKGELVRDFSHLPLKLTAVKGKDGKTSLKVELSMGNRKQVAAVRTVCSHVKNMIKGVTLGYRYSMKLVYAHFPISINVENEGKLVEIRNFIGEKIVRSVTARGDATKIKRGGKDNKDVVVEGIDIDAVSQTAAQIQQICEAKNRDLRKFLDGVYVETKGVVKAEE